MPIISACRLLRGLMPRVPSVSAVLPVAWRPLSRLDALDAPDCKFNVLARAQPRTPLDSTHAQPPSRPSTRSTAPAATLTTTALEPSLSARTSVARTVVVVRADELLASCACAGRLIAPVTTVAKTDMAAQADRVRADGVRAER